MQINSRFDMAGIRKRLQAAFKYVVYGVGALGLSATVANLALAQMKVGNSPTSLNANAVLEVEHTSKGFLLPRVALTSTSLASPLSNHVAGMSVYNTATAGDVTPGVYTNNGSLWVSAVATCTCGDIKQGLQSADHGDWKLLDGRTHTCGSVSTNANASGMVLMTTGTTLGVATGSMSKTIAQNQLPNIAPTITVVGNSAGTPAGTVSIQNTTSTMQGAGTHSHTLNIVSKDDGNFSNSPGQYPTGDASKFNGANHYISTEGVGDHAHAMNAHNHSATFTGNALASHDHTASASSINGNVTQQTLDVTPRALSVNTFMCVR